MVVPPGNADRLVGILGDTYACTAIVGEPASQPQRAMPSRRSAFPGTKLTFTLRDVES